MTNNDLEPRSASSDHPASAIERKAERRLRAMRTRPSSIWYGLGTMGVIGWNVAIPTTLGVLVGNWLDRYVPMSFSWVLTGMIGGVLVGCLNAWGWITSERRKIQARRIDENREE